MVDPATQLPSGRTEGTGAPARADGRGAGIAPRKPQCAAQDCDVRVGRGRLFCVTHWHRLPGKVRQGLYGRGYASPIDRVQRLIRQAIAMLAGGEGSS